MPNKKLKSVTFPCEITKRGNSSYITIFKIYQDMLGVADGDIVNVTLTVPEEYTDDGNESEQE